MWKIKRLDYQSKEEIKKLLNDWIDNYMRSNSHLVVAKEDDSDWIPITDQPENPEFIAQAEIICKALNDLDKNINA